MVKLPINILLVDDERDFVEILSLRLTDAGHRVRTAYSGQQALSVLAETEPEALPDIDVVILLTGHGAVDTAVKGLKSGAFAYLLKPADFDQLTVKLEAARNQRDAKAARIREAEARALMRRSGGLLSHD